MTMSKKAYRFRLYPTASQCQALERMFGCCRFLWNQELNEHQAVYQQYKPVGGIPTGYKYITEKEYKQQFVFLKNADAKALQAVTANLWNAYDRFFQNLTARKQGLTKHKVGLPKFKSKKNEQTYTTYNINHNIKIDFIHQKIKVPKIDSWLTFCDDRQFTAPIRHITIRKTVSGQYFISILVEEPFNDPITILSAEKIEAFDMSAKEFLVSELTHYSNPHFYRQQENSLKRLHRRVSRKKKGSTNRQKAR